MLGEKFKWRPHENESTNARHRGGATHPLELFVMDNYQAGEIRSTKNLSGGESGIIGAGCQGRGT